MAQALIVPGVSVRTEFDVSPPLPARSGILGAVGVVDRHELGVQGVTTRQELIELYGAATQFSFPEAFGALANGVSEVRVSPVDPRSGQPATLVLTDDEGDQVVRLVARAVGPWANNLAARVTRRLGADGRTVRSVKLEVLLFNRVRETHDALILRPGHDQDLFTVVNRDSSLVVAIDPVFETDLPVVDAALLAFVDAPAAASSGRLTSAGAPVIDLVASQPGDVGDTVSVTVSDGRALAQLPDGAGANAVRVRASRPGPEGTNIQLEVVANAAAGGVDVRVIDAAGNQRTYAGLTGVNQLVSVLNADPDVDAERMANVLPAPTPGRVALSETRTVTIVVEGVSTAEYADLLSADAIVGALGPDPTVDATLVGAGTDLPDAGADNTFYLRGGRDAGLARGFRGQSHPDDDVVELLPAPDTDGSQARFRVVAGSEANTVRIVSGVDPGDGFRQQEDFDALSMDPDAPRYLPSVLAAESGLLRAIDRYPRAHASTFPRASRATEPFAGGTAPGIAAFEAAIDALALEEDVDLMLAGLQGWADPNLDGVAVQQAMLGHAITQADLARPRIVLGSIRPQANADVRAISDHVGQVTNRRFVLVAPAGAEGAVAGLLGHLDFFQSPTFKQVASPGVPLVAYRDSELNDLVGAEGNVCVVVTRRGRGTIVVKGITTDGFQISVLRVADHCVREVNAIAARFIGELNNEESRDALRQMIVATFAQMERDGALVPSVDGKSPAFQVEVYASQNDTAGGIVRVDIAVRPVRAIDYVYATIRIKN